MNKIGKDTKIRQKSKISTIESRQCNSKLDQEMHGKKTEMQIWKLHMYIVMWKYESKFLMDGVIDIYK